jgi:hypothetical protein
MDKHSSLLSRLVSDEEKKFYEIDTWKGETEDGSFVQLQVSSAANNIKPVLP